MGDPVHAGELGLFIVGSVGCPVPDLVRQNCECGYSTLLPYKFSRNDIATNNDITEV